MYKSLLFVFVLCVVVIEARPKWQILPDLPGYVPVYIRNGDTPLEEINPDLAEAFHALPAGRSVSKELEAAPENPDDAPLLLPEVSQVARSFRKPVEKKMKPSYEILKPIERR